jgi:hypothetical protein
VDRKIDSAETTPDIVPCVRDAIIGTVGNSLVGLYLYGSSVTGEFDPDVSDVDFIAVLACDPTDELAHRLRAMHESLAECYPKWAERIEVTYVAESRLRGLPGSIPCIAVISPGKSFDLVEAGPDWILSWLPAREEAISLKGPEIASIIPDLPRQEFVEAVRGRLKAFRLEVRDTSPLGSCAYAILTVCRGLHTLEVGNRTSKRTAAKWLSVAYPEWASLVQSALGWRQQQWKSTIYDPNAVLATRDFVSEMTEAL